MAATEPCRHCGKTLAAGDAWALTQHSQHCPGQTSRGRSQEPGAASASGRHSSSRRPRAKDRSASRGRRQAQREPDWNDPATYFHRDRWEYAHIRDEDEAFRAWLEGSSQPSSGFATTDQDNGGANHEADQRYHGDQIQSTDTSWRDWSREEWDRYPHDPALWRERGWQDWSQSESQTAVATMRKQKHLLSSHGATTCGAEQVIARSAGVTTTGNPTATRRPRDGHPGAMARAITGNPTATRRQKDGHPGAMARRPRDGHPEGFV